MPHVLLVMSADHQSQRAAADAIALAQAQRCPVTVAVVIDPTGMDHVSNTLDEIGFMGEKIGEGVRTTLLREYRTRAETAVAEITARARRAGLVADGSVEEGDPTEIGPRLARSLHATTVLLVAERRSWLSRLLSGNPVRMPDLPGCEVRVVEEDS